MPGELLFRARGLSKVYGTGTAQVVALHAVNLDLMAGEFVVILGPSGSGKSTLLNILGGLDIPSAGDVTFRDHVLTGATEDALTQYRREHVGFVFQFYNLSPGLTALENVQLVTDLTRGDPDGLFAATVGGLGLTKRELVVVVSTIAVDAHDANDERHIRGI